MPIDTLALWRHMVHTRDSSGLDALLSDDVAFHSPIVHKPKLGRQATRALLAAMFAGFFNHSFRYVREATGPASAMLEFEVQLDDLTVNGVHILAWNDEGRLLEFKVMLRPYTALNLVAQKMGQALQAQP